MVDAALGQGEERSNRTLLLAFLLVTVPATLPWLAPGASPVHVGAWLVAMAALTVTSWSGQSERWLGWLEPVVMLAMVTWLVFVTGGAHSPYDVLYLPLVGFIAVFRGPRVFMTVVVLAVLAWLLPRAVQMDQHPIAEDALLAAVAGATLFVVNRAAASYRDTNRLFETVLAHHAGPTYAITPNAVMTWANEPLQRLLGLPLEEIVGVPWPRFVAPGEIERLMPQFLQTLEGEPQQVTIETDAPGGRFQLRGTAYPMYRNGRLFRVLGINENVTDLETAAFGAEALRRTLDVLAIPVAIFEAEHFETLYANDAARLLSDAGPSDGRLTWSQLHPALRRDLPEPGAARTETIVRPDGAGAGSLDVTIHSLRERRPLVVLTGIDATERVRRESALEQIAAAEHAAAQRLRHLDRMKNAFLTAVSHELRTPLTVILGGVKSLQRFQVASEPPARRALEEAMVRQAERLTELLDRLLDLDRLTRGVERASSTSSFDVMEVVRRQVESAPEGLEVSVAGPDRLDTVADESQVERIVANLLENAAKYAGGSPVQVVVTAVGENGVRLEVIDAGPGIPEEDRARVFEPFYRIDLEHPQPGTGIGLALVAEFAAIHGGRAWAEEAPGGGARMIVELPGANGADRPDRAAL